MRDHEPVWAELIGVRIVAETDRAFLIEYDGEEVWIPLSQIEDPEQYCVGDELHSILVTEWIADQKGLDY